VPLFAAVAHDPIGHSTSSCSAALIRISGFPLYISIRPVILTCFPSMPEDSRTIWKPAMPQRYPEWSCPKSELLRFVAGR